MQGQLSGDRTVIERFMHLERAHRLAHAYLFYGPEGIGKKATALSIAKALNCLSPDRNMSTPYCDDCASCRKIDSGNHPDIFIVENAEGGTIKIEDIRGIIERLQLRAYEARVKVVVLVNVEQLTMEASNALLKTLEEPVADTMMLLTTSMPERNLPTIRSRCQLVPFRPIAEDVLAEEMTTRYALDARQAHFVSHFAEGCRAAAQRLYENDIMRRRDRIIDTFFFAPDSSAFINETVSDKKETRLVLEILLSWFRDVLVFKTGGDEQHLMHADRIADIRTVADAFSYREIRGILQEIVGAFQLLIDNFNIKISLSLIKERIWTR